MRAGLNLPALRRPLVMFAAASCSCVALTGDAAPLPSSHSPAAHLLRFSRLVDGTGEVLSGREMVVREGTIVAVGDDLGARFPDATRVDLEGLTGLPGLIDAHVHVTYGLDGPSRGDAWTQLLEETTPAARLEAAKDNAARMLRLGITTARDLFALDGVDFQLRNLIEQGVVPGPRLFLSGTGIHPQVMPDLPMGPERIASMSQRANEVADAGATWLKIFATTGTASDLTGEQIYTSAEIDAATRTAHTRGLKVALHAYGPSAVGDALRADVDSIEHAVDVDDETLADWAKRGISYVPTIDHNRYYAEHHAEYGFDEAAGEALMAFTRKNVHMLRRAHEAGVPIVFGSDAVMSMFGQNTRELEWFVQAGMTPGECLSAATFNGARLLGAAHYLGRLTPGHAADIIAVRGDPLQDIAAITRGVVWVMKAGTVVVDER